MIPKILHYIWLGGSKPPLIKECVNSYSKNLPDYKIIEWNEASIDTSLYSPSLQIYYKKFYSSQQYAFCSDIARLYLLKIYGGFYVDADTEFVAPIPDSIREIPCLCRGSHSQEIGNGYIWGCEKEDRFVDSCIRWFSENLISDGSTYGSSWIFKNILQKYFSLFGYDSTNKETQDVADYRIYSADYFCCWNYAKKKMEKTENSIAVHHFATSWVRR